MLLASAMLLSCGQSGRSDLSSALLLSTMSNESEPVSRIDLTIFDFGGQPLRDTTVYYSKNEASAAALTRFQSARTNENGELSIYLPEGYYAFEIFSIGAGFELLVGAGGPESHFIGPSRSGYVDVWLGLLGYPPGSGPGDGGDTGEETGDGDSGDGGDSGGETNPVVYRDIAVQSSGLTGTAQLKNQSNNETLQITANGLWYFPTAIEEGTQYSISLLSSPEGQNCSLSQASGYASMSMPAVILECSTPEPTYKISGVVEGLHRHIYLGLTTEGEYIQVWSDDGSPRNFSFRSEVKSGEEYNIKIPSIPFNFTCEIENASGTVTDHDITNVRVICTEPESPAPQSPVTVSTLQLEGISYLYGIDYAPNGYLYLSHNGENVIKVHPDTGATYVVLQEGPDNGNPEFDTISGITVGPDGTIYLNDTELFTTYRISTRYSISVFLEQFVAFTAFDLDVGPDGAVYIADYGNERILRVDQQGNHTVVVDLDYNPMGLVVAEDGTIYFTVAQMDNVYQFKHGIVSRLAGADGCGFQDGTGIFGTFCGPDGLAIDRDGNIVVADRFNNAIRRITPDGVVTTVAGTGEEGQLDGPGGEATFHSPRRLTTLPDGRIAVAARQSVIRIISPDGTDSL